MIKNRPTGFARFYNPGLVTQALGAIAIFTIVFDQPSTWWYLWVIPGILGLSLGVLEHRAHFSPRPAGVIEPLVDAACLTAAVALSHSPYMFAFMPFATVNQISREGRAIGWGVVFGILGSIIGALMLGMTQPLPWQGLMQPAFLSALMGVFIVGLMQPIINYRVRRALDFLAALQHEVKTPLTMIDNALAALERALGGVLSPIMRLTFASIRANTNDCREHTNNVLDYARSLSLRTEVVNMDFFVPQVVRDMILRMLPTMQTQRQLNLIISGPRFRLMTSAQMIDQIVTNFVSNAFKYGAQSRIDVLVRTAREKDGSMKVQIVVADEGPGVPADMRGRLFSEYGTARTETETRSTGIGLVNSHKASERMGGGAEYKPVNPRGAMFIANFKAKPVDMAMDVSSRLQGASIIAVTLSSSVIGSLKKLVEPRTIHIVPDIEAAIAQTRLCQMMEGPVVLVIGQEHLTNMTDFVSRTRSLGRGVVRVAVMETASDEIARMMLLSRGGFSAALPMNPPLTQVAETVAGALDIADLRVIGKVAKRTFYPGKSAVAKPVLVVEDERMTREEIRQKLLGHHFEVVTAGSATEARQLLLEEKREFSIAIMDYNLGDGRAHEVVHEMARARVTIPVVIMTAMATGNDRQEDLKLFPKGSVIGIRDKPIREDDLMELVYRHARPQPPEKRIEAVKALVSLQPVTGAITIEQLLDDGAEEMATYFCRAVPQLLATARSHLMQGEMTPFYAMVHKLVSVMRVFGEDEINAMLMDMEKNKKTQAIDALGWLEDLESNCMKSVTKRTARMQRAA